MSTNGSEQNNSVEDLSLKKYLKVIKLNLSYNEVLSSGFYSETLGTSHYYNSEVQDRNILKYAIEKTADEEILCDDMSGEPKSKLKRRHTLEQLNQVRADYNAHKHILYTAVHSKRKAILSAEDEAAIDQVTLIKKK